MQFISRVVFPYPWVFFCVSDAKPSAVGGVRVRRMEDEGPSEAPESRGSLLAISRMKEVN